MSRYTALLRDPRHYQIILLSILLALGIFHIGLEIRPEAALLIFATALMIQYSLTEMFGLERFEPRSALITSLSLSLLLRSNDLWVFPLAAAAAIGSKFLIRYKNKHIFNPANLGIVAMLIGGQAWVSPGQWGSTLWLAFLIACLGFLVITRSERTDMALFFLGSFCAILFGRALWLGDPLAIPVHQLQNGALLIFAFFMITDPKSIPDTRRGRLAFAVLVASLATWMKFELYIQDALFYALALGCLMVPIIDQFAPGPRYRWKPALL